MDTSDTRVTREQAAELAGVSEREIQRWAARGLIGVERDPEFRRPATYDREEVIAVEASTRAAGRRIHRKT